MVKLIVSKGKVKLAPEGAPSNKQQTPGISPSKDDLASVSGDDAPTPFIDKLSVVWIPLTQVKAKEALGQLYADVGHNKDIFKASYLGKKGGKTRIALDAVPDAKMWPFLQWKRNEDQIEKLRLEFVPVDLGFSGLAELHSILGGFLEGGWDNFVKRGKVTRIDIAIDYPALSMNQLLFLPKPLITSKQWASDGQLQTFCQGKKPGNQLQIYDRAAKRKAQGKSWQGKTGIRIEKSINVGHKKFVKDLPDLKNPFSSLKLIEAMPPCPAQEVKQYIWELFKFTVAELGLATALTLLPADKRKMYVDHISNVSAAWWDPDQIWLKWKPMLGELQIADPKKWS